MSSTILKIIPANPAYVPDKIQQDKAKVFLAELYKDKEIEFYIADLIEFVDQGENFENVSCNLCGQEIKIEYWQNAMDEAYEKQFTDLDFITLCCHKKTSLNDLTYNMTAGFAKFVMTISDAENEIDEKDINNLEQILGMRLKIIWAHY
jgi:hypothetical protein